MDQIIRLQSSDGDVFIVDMLIAKMFNTIRRMQVVDGELVSLPNIKTDILRKVLEWASYHEFDPEPSLEDKCIASWNTLMSPWDAEFLTVAQDTMIELLMAASFLDIPGLVNLTRKAVAGMPLDVDAASEMGTLG